MPWRVYRCLVCASTEDRREAWDDPGPRACPKCGALAYKRVPQAPRVLVRGSPLVDGERRFVRPRVVDNPDGSSTVYGSLQEARRGELERAQAVVPEGPGAGLARTLLARKNARQLATGMLPGRDSTALRQAIEEAPR